VKELAHANLQEQSLAPTADETTLVIRPKASRTGTAFGFDVLGKGLTLRTLSCRHFNMPPPPPPLAPPKPKASKHHLPAGVQQVGSSAVPTKRTNTSNPWVLVGFLVAVLIGIYMQADVLYALCTALGSRIRPLLGLPPVEPEQPDVADESVCNEGHVVVELKDYGRSAPSKRKANGGAAYNGISNAEEPVPTTPAKQRSTKTAPAKGKAASSTKVWLVAVKIDAEDKELRVPMAATIKDSAGLKKAIVRAGKKRFADSATPPMWSLEQPHMDLFIVDDDTYEATPLTKETPFFLVKKARRLRASLPTRPGID